MSDVTVAGARAPGRWHRLRPSGPWAALPVLMAGTFMIVIDFFIVNVAFPSIQSGLHAGAGDVEWIVAGYGLTFASFLITAGRLGDHVGRRRMLTTGLMAFALSSSVCGLAPSAEILILARAVQGLAAAVISPSVLALIGVLYTGAARARAVAVYAATLGAGAVCGQLIGGLLIAWNVAGLGWRTIFFINVPVALGAVAVLWHVVPESHADQPRRLDWLGMALVTFGLVTAVLPLVEGPQADWPAWTWASLGLAAAVLAGFCLHQRWLCGRGGDPLIDPQVIRQRSFALGLITQVVLWSSVASFFFVLAFYLQRGRGLNALQAGSVFTILASAYLSASLRAPALAARCGRRVVIASGALVMAAGLTELAAVTAADWADSLWALVPGLLLAGTGQGLTIGPLVATVLSYATPSQAGVVSGLLSTMQQVGNAVGVAVTGVVFYGALHGGYVHAFTASLIELSCLPIAVTILTVTMPVRNQNQQMSLRTRRRHP